MSLLIEQIRDRAKVDLSLPEGVTPAEELPRFKRYLKKESALLKDMHRSGGLGREVCLARAVVIDSIIQHLFDSFYCAINAYFLGSRILVWSYKMG